MVTTPATLAALISVIPPGTQSIASPVVLGNHVHVTGTSASTLVSAVVPTDVYEGSMLLAQPPNETDGSLDDASMVGGTSADIFLAVMPATGQYLRLSHGFSAQVFLVTGVQSLGDEHYTVTLDRPVRLPFEAGDTVMAYSDVPHDIQIDGGQMVIGGTGDLYAELFAAKFSIVRNVYITGAYGSLRPFTFMMSFDVGGYNNTFDNITIDGTSSDEFVSAPVHEAGEGALMRNITSTNLTGNGPALVDCIDSGFQNVRTDNAPNGWGQAIGSQGESFGSLDSWSADGESRACLFGLVIDKATNTHVTDFVATSSLSTGVYVTSRANDTLLDGVVTEDSVDRGVTVSGHGEHGTTIRRWAASEMNGHSTGAVITADSGPVVFNEFQVTSAGEPYAGAAFDASGVRTTLQHGTIELASAKRVAVIARAGVTELDDVRVQVESPQGTICAYVCEGATLRLGSGSDFSQCDIPVYAEPRAYLDRGTVTMDGTAPVSVPFPDLDTSDDVTLTLIQQSCEEALSPPTVTLTPGVGFTVVASDPLDASVYAYTISRIRS